MRKPFQLTLSTIVAIKYQNKLYGVRRRKSQKPFSDNITHEYCSHPIPSNEGEPVIASLDILYKLCDACSLPLFEDREKDIIIALLKENRSAE